MISLFFRPTTTKTTDSVSSTVVAPFESGGFLQMDDGMAFDENSNMLTMIGRRPFEAKKEYVVATSLILLKGVDKNLPLMKWLKNEATVRVSLFLLLLFL